MLVRVKKGLGNFGHVQNGHVQPKNYASGAFEVSDAKGRELIARGIVDEVEGVTAPAPPAPAAPEPKKPTKVEKKAPKKATKAEKKEPKKAVKLADEAPTFDAVGGVE